MPIDLEYMGLQSGTRTMPYQDTDHTIRKMYEIIHGPRGEKSLKVRLAVEEIIRKVDPRDKVSQLMAIYSWFVPRYHFVNDPIEVELVKDPERILEEIRTRGIVLGDCDDASIFLATAPRTIGIQTRLVRTGFKNTPLGYTSGPFTHVSAQAIDQYKRPIILDPVAGANTREMLGRVKTYKF